VTLKRKLGITAALVVVLVGALIAVLGKRDSEPPIAATFVRYETNVTNAAVTAVVQITNHSRFEVVNICETSDGSAFRSGLMRLGSYSTQEVTLPPYEMKMKVRCLRVSGLRYHIAQRLWPIRIKPQRWQIEIALPPPPPNPPLP